MKSCLLIIFCCIAIFSSSFCQYYLRGEVRDEKGRLMPGVKIALQSKGNYPFSSGGSGLFGIPTSLAIDTVTLTYDGYEIFHKAVASEQYQILVMKTLPAMTSLMKTKLSSKTINLEKDLISNGVKVQYSEAHSTRHRLGTPSSSARTPWSMNVAA